jgi:hypothetical protein
VTDDRDLRMNEHQPVWFALVPHFTEADVARIRDRLKAIAGRGVEPGRLVPRKCQSEVKRRAATLAPSAGSFGAMSFARAAH